VNGCPYGHTQSVMILAVLLDFGSALCVKGIWGFQCKIEVNG
jgi:hypothetical protein